MDRKLNIAGRLGQMAMHSHLTPIAAVLIFLVGLAALFMTPREENPQIDVPAANVFVTMPGAGPEEILNLVVRPLERVLREMPGVDHTYGMALEGQGIVTVQFDVGENKETSLVKLYDRLMHNLDRIPPGAAQPLVKPLDVDDVPIVAITFSSNAHTDLELKRVADRVKEQLTPLAGVSVADVIGGRDRVVTVNVDPARLVAHGLTFDQLHDALASANVRLRVGEAIDDNQVKPVQLAGALHSADEVGKVVVAVRNDRPIYLQDVADITDGPGEIEHVQRIGFGPARHGQVEQQGKSEQNAVTLTLAKKRDTNAVVVSQHIIAKLETLKGDFIPDDINVTISRNSGKEANAAVNYLIEHLGIAIVSVIIILLVFLGWREASIVTMNIPLILFVVLAIGFVADQTINRITLFALILALGLLVDDAIVVIENIHRHLHKGVNSLADKAQVIINATNETGRPTIIATIAVILAFIPMAFVTGMMGPYMGPIPFNAPIAMLASLIIAYMFTPWIAQRWLPCRITTDTLEERDQSPRDWLHRFYLRTATPLIDKPAIRGVFFISVGLLFLAALWQPAWLFFRPAGINGPLTPGAVELKMLPKANNNTFNITIDMPEGTPLEMTDAVSRDIGEVLHRNPMVLDYESYVGMAGPVDFNGMLKGALIKRGPHIAEIRVNLIDKRQRRLKSEEIVLDLRRQLGPVYQRYPDANIKLVEDPPGPPVRATLHAEIYGPDYATLRKLAGDVRNEFQHTWGVVDVDDSVGDDQKEYRVKINKDKAAASGIDTRDVVEVLRDYVSGFDIGTLYVPQERNPVMIRIHVPREFRIAPRDLDRIFVTNAEDKQIPVASFASIEEVTVDKPVFTKDGFPVVYVTGEPATGSQVYPLLDLDARLDQQPFPHGTLATGGMRFTHTTPDPAFNYQLLWDGEMRLTLDVFRDLGAAFIVALVLIYLLLVAYYGGFILPLIVMGSIPLTMIGIFPGHLITQQPFTATSMIGMIALAGIVVRNSLLLIDFMEDFRAGGADLRASVLEAGAVRIRPILLTALAIIAGTSIMITDPVFGGLGVAMAFGTLASTLLTLFVIPLLYFLWQRNKGPVTVNN